MALSGKHVWNKSLYFNTIIAATGEDYQTVEVEESTYSNKIEEKEGFEELDVDMEEEDSNLEISRMERDADPEKKKKGREETKG